MAPVATGDRGQPRLVDAAGVGGNLYAFRLSDGAPVWLGATEETGAPS